MKFISQEYEEFYEKCKTKKLVLFGAYAGCIKCIAKFNQLKNASLICDNDSEKWGTSFMDWVVQRPEILCDIKDEIVVLITTSHDKQVRKQLNKMGINDIYSFYMLYMLESVDACNALYEHAGDLNKVKNLLADEKSKFVYDRLVSNKRCGCRDYREILEPLSEMEYFPKDTWFSYEDNEVFIDAGSYEGLTTLDFIDIVGGKFKNVCAFEPSHNIYLARHNLRKYIEQNKVILSNKGLFSEIGEACSHVEGNYGQTIMNKKGGYRVPVTTLDAEVQDRITFIKMDIEGAELEALKGSVRHITSYKPKLAICIYHKLEDLWEIPLFIKELVPEYRIYIRHYANTFYLEEFANTSLSTVLYAV